MANKTTVALTENQFRELIKTMYEGGAGFRPNPKIATILTLEANLGLRKRHYKRWGKIQTKYNRRKNRKEKNLHSAISNKTVFR